MSDRPPNLRRIRQLLIFCCQGTRDKGPLRRRSPRGSLPARRPLPALHGENGVPKSFFISWTICTKFGMHVTWDHGRPPIKFETNPTTFNFRPPLRGCLATSNATCHIFQSAADAARTVRFRSKLQGRSSRSSSLCLPSFKSMLSGMKILHAL